MIQINIPEDFVEGKECLTNEVPWQVPESIYLEAENLREEDIVLELGSGGSTLFFARRTKYVMSVETSPEWYFTVNDTMRGRGVKNVFYSLLPDENHIIDFIKMIQEDVTVVSVDTQGGYNRSRMLTAILEKNFTNLRMIVLDNYAHDGLFPDHHDKMIMPEPWDVYTADHKRWAGKGTRIYIKK